MAKRKASHAGSWYSADPGELKSQLEQWINNAAPGVSGNGPVRALIAPHAGLSYSGRTAAHAYARLSLDSSVKRIFLLGPSHHVYVSGCAVSRCKEYQTPMGSVQVDLDLSRGLRKNFEFQEMSVAVDEDEHSLEMHLPFIYYLLDRHQLLDKVQLVPILVGALNDRQHRMYGEIFSSYLSDPANRFIISSDFCHWGPRFNYFYQPQSESSDKAIHEGIEELDRRGMHLIEQLNCQGFAEYLRETGNTICGRHPIQVLLHAIEVLKENDGNQKWSVAFVCYDQSSRAKLPTDHSVSYAAATITC